MKQKINFLIGFSAVVLVALMAMQYYLVKTAYDYKVAQFRDEIKIKIGEITQDYSAIDSSFYYKKDLAYKTLAEDYIVNKSMRQLLRKDLIRSRFKNELSQRLQQEFKDEIPNLSIDFAVVLNKFVLYQNNRLPDTLFAEKPLIGNKLYGSMVSFDDAFLIRNYVGTTSGSVLVDNKNSAYQLLTEDTLYVTIQNWQQIILRRMITILGCAILSIITLITLFIIALKSLIRQKKVSDVKTDFINNITHELKTPLTTLSVSTKFLTKPEIRDNDAVFNSVLDTMSRQNMRLQQLIDQVLTQSLGYKDIELLREKIDAIVFLSQIITDFKIAFPEINITIDFEQKNVVLLLDKFYLTTAIVNVLENAVKYGSTNIIIKTAVKNSQFSIHILDNGIGIAKNKQLLLFDKFYRVEEGNLHTVKGLGLGLYYVSQIIKAHKGTIAVASELGKGAAFTISIPTA